MYARCEVKALSVNWIISSFGDFDRPTVRHSITSPTIANFNFEYTFFELFGGTEVDYDSSSIGGYILTLNVISYIESFQFYVCMGLLRGEGDREITI